MAVAAYKTEHVAETPRGWRVRTVTRGSHQVRVAFPPGSRKKGSGKVVQILHPKSEQNPSCIVSHKAKSNPAELLIFGNPEKKNSSKLEQQRAARERAERIRSARRHPTRNAGFVESIRPGDRVTILTPQNQQRTGRAVMRSSSGGWVLNMGGAHGTPGLADDRNIVRVSKRKGNPPVKMTVFFDTGIKKYTAAIYDPKFGNLYASGFTKKQAAKALHDRVREYRRSGTVPARGGYGNPKRSTPRKRMRSNPSEEKEAVKLFESFHGKEPKEIVEKQVSAAMRLDYAALGDLIKLIVITPLGQRVEFDFEGDGVKLASSPDGKTLYCIGGNQNLAKCLDAKSLEKDLVDLGECVQVEYLARKIHANYQPVVYYHKMGEKTGDPPTLMYDKLKRQIFFVGGAYYIDKDKGVSPGIEN